jgi:hypothetical protein
VHPGATTSVFMQHRYLVIRQIHGSISGQFKRNHYFNFHKLERISKEKKDFFFHTTKQ